MAANLIYRTATQNPPSSTQVKGSPLTHEEMDGNLKSLDAAIDDLAENLDGNLNFTTLASATLPAADADLLIIRQGSTNKKLPYSALRTEFAVDGKKDLFVAGTHYVKNVGTSVTLTSVPAKPNTVKVFFNGVYQNKDTYYLVGSTINFGVVGTPAVIDADSVEVQYEIPSQFVGLSSAEQAVLTAAQSNALASANAAAISAADAEDVRTDFAATTGASLVGYETGTVQDALNLAKDGAIFAGKYLAADGVTDDSANLLSALTAANGKRLVLPYRSTVYLASLVNYEGSIDIDLNGSRIVAPNRALHILRMRRYYTTGNSTFFFSLTEGGYSFSIPAGWDIQAGDHLALRSTTVHETAGNNKYGYLGTVLSITGGVAKMSHPFDYSFGVNMVDVYDGISGRIVNGTIDQSGFANPGTFLDAGIAPECVLFRGAKFEFDGLTLIGNDFTAIGLHAQATVVRGNKSYGHGHANVNGYGATGRLGYGILVHGQDVVLDQCGGGNCKHVLMTGSRDFIGGKVTFRSPVAWHNPDEWYTTITPPAGLQSKWGAPIDAHAGVREFVVVDPVVTGGNALINVRNPRAKIIRPVLYHYGSRASSSDLFAICAYEGPVASHEIIDPEYIFCEAEILPGGHLPYLYGLCAYGANQDHGSITIRNPYFENGGGVFGTFVNTGEPFNNTSTIKSIDVTGIRGNITDGVRVSSLLQYSGVDQNLWKKVSRVNVSFDNVEFVQRYGKIDGMAVDLSDVSDIGDIIKITGRVNVFPGMTTTFAAVEIGEQGKAWKLPPVIDLDGLKLQAPRGGVYIRSTDTTQAIQRLSFDNAEILHALNESGSTSAHGVTLEHGATLGKRATFAGARILKNGSAATNAKAINTSGANIDASFAVVEGDIPDIVSLANLPQGIRHIDGSLIPVFNTGNAAETYSTEGRRIFCTAVPPTRFSGIPAGTRVQRATPTTSGAQEWMFTGAGWVAVLTI